MEALLGGGHLRFQQNWRDLQAFQLTFLAWFKQKNAEDPGKAHIGIIHMRMSLPAEVIRYKKAPRYQERSVP